MSRWRPNAATYLKASLALTITTLGFTTWHKTLTQSTGNAFGQSVKLPHPLWLLPQTLSATITFDNGPGAAPTLVHESANWQAFS